MRRSSARSGGASASAEWRPFNSIAAAVARCTRVCSSSRRRASRPGCATPRSSSVWASTSVPAPFSSWFGSFVFYFSQMVILSLVVRDATVARHAGSGLEGLHRPRARSCRIRSRSFPLLLFIIASHSKPLPLVGRQTQARALYERLLAKTQHVKVWLSFAQFEASVNEIARARALVRDGVVSSIVSDSFDDRSIDVGVQLERAFALFKGFVSCLLDARRR